jgi:hypothetical protein
MKKFLLIAGIICVVSSATGLWLPWWSPAVIALITCMLLAPKNSVGFAAGTVGVGLAWLLAASIQDLNNEHILSTKMAALFQLPSSSWFIIVTMLLGSTIGGIGGWIGSLLSARK